VFSCANLSTFSSENQPLRLQRIRIPRIMQEVFLLFMSIEGKLYYRDVYLKSDKWQNVRLEALVREKARCQICGEESISNDAHHIWYPTPIWDTEERHLIILCRSCHEFIHIMLPDCNKTTDEQKGTNEWLRFKGAITIWRRTHAQIFLPGESPKELRNELARVKALLVQTEATTASTPQPPLLSPMQPHKSVVAHVVRLVKEWGRAYEDYADNVNKPVAEADFEI
jgi:hypothetical protein